ncbi:hypothetical protein ACFL2G_01045 [Candidatus Omnitrophota bacterium]
MIKLKGIFFLVIVGLYLCVNISDASALRIPLKDEKSLETVSGVMKGEFTNKYGKLYATDGKAKEGNKNVEDLLDEADDLGIIFVDEHGKTLTIEKIRDNLMVNNDEIEGYRGVQIFRLNGNDGELKRNEKLLVFFNRGAGIFWRTIDGLFSIRDRNHIERLEAETAVKKNIVIHDEKHGDVAMHRVKYSTGEWGYESDEVVDKHWYSSGYKLTIPADKVRSGEISTTGAKGINTSTTGGGNYDIGDSPTQGLSRKDKREIAKRQAKIKEKIEKELYNMAYKKPTGAKYEKMKEMASEIGYKVETKHEGNRDYVYVYTETGHTMARGRGAPASDSYVDRDYGDADLLAREKEVLKAVNRADTLQEAQEIATKAGKQIEQSDSGTWLCSSSGIREERLARKGWVSNCFSDLTSTELRDGEHSIKELEEYTKKKQRHRSYSMIHKEVESLRRLKLLKRKKVGGIYYYFLTDRGKKLSQPQINELISMSELQKYQILETSTGFNIVNNKIATFL